MTSSQQQLFETRSPDITRGKHHGEKHSVAANEIIQPKKQTLQNRIVCLLGSGAGLTREEIQAKIGIATQSASARCAELKEQKLVVVISHRAGKYGVTAGVLTLTTAGIARYNQLRGGLL